MIKTKEAPRVIAAGQRQTVNLAFAPASEIEMKTLAVGDDIPDGYVAGWASTSDLDHYGDVIQEDAFSESIEARGLRGPSGIKLLIGHNWEKMGGEIKVLEYRKKGAQNALWIEAQMNLDISYVRDAYLAAKMIGGINFSVGFQLQDYEFVEDEKGAFDFLQINRGDLFEVSIVPFPGNEKATMDFIKSAPDGADEIVGIPKSLAEFEKAIVAAGLVKCRNDANRITQVVKSCFDLFQKKADPDDKKEKDPPTGPVLDSEKLTELSALVAKMKGVLAPVAK